MRRSSVKRINRKPYILAYIIYSMSQQHDPKDVTAFKKDKLQYMYGITNLQIIEHGNAKLKAIFFRENDPKYGWIKSTGFILIPKEETPTIASKLASLYAPDFVFWFINTYGCPSDWESY